MFFFLTCSDVSRRQRALSPNVCSFLLDKGSKDKEASLTNNTLTAYFFMFNVEKKPLTVD